MVVMPPRPFPEVRVQLLGRFEIARDGRVLRAEAWTRRKAAALLQRVALERRLVKDQVIDFLWPDSDSASGHNNLYRTLHALRQTLENGLGEGAASLFSFEDGVLALDDSVWVDAHEFESLALSPDPANQDRAYDLYPGDLLPDDPYADWISPHRERLRARFHGLSLARAARLRDSGDHARAVSTLARLLDFDRADETAHRELMRVHALAGRRHDALRQYQACQEALSRELDIEPSPETVALYRAILSGEVGPRPAERSTLGSTEVPVTLPTH